VRIPRSSELVKLIYFLAKYARSGQGASRPPEVFGDRNWREVYELFFDRLGDGRIFSKFRSISEQLRRDNIGRHINEGIPLLPRYQAILSSWTVMTHDEQWAEICQWMTEGVVQATGRLR